MTLNRNYNAMRTVGSLAIVALLFSACSGASEPEAPPAESEAPAATSDTGDTDAAAFENPLPEQFSEAIRWGTEPYYPPFTLSDDEDEEKIVGVDMDIIEAISDRLGVEGKVEMGTFDGFIPGIVADRYDLVIDVMADTEERREQVNFIDYFQSGTSIFVKTGNPHGINEADDICGLKVAALKGTFQIEESENQGKKCVADGKEDVEVQVYPTQGPANLALVSGRADVIFMDAAAGEYAASQSNGGFERVGEMQNPNRKGIVVAKKNVELMLAVQEALQQLIDEGVYDEILTKWGQEQGSIPTATINDGHDY